MSPARCLVVLALLYAAGRSAAPAGGEPPRAFAGPVPSPADSLPPLASRDGWRLVWHDEFEGTALDTSKWTRMGDWKRRDGYWMKRDAFLDGNGFLVLRTRRENGRVTSGAITTRGKFERAFGYFVVRCRMPSQPGHWPAFWLTCPAASAPGGDGRAGTEIDVVEMPWRSDRAVCALHWSGYGKGARSSVQEMSIPAPADGFHTFGVLWTAGAYVFDVDGRVVWRTDAGGVSRAAESVNLTDEVGAWGGDIAKAALPDSFLVDYVRVYAPTR
jgi:beta-glucanase (GH16 family)